MNRLIILVLTASCLFLSAVAVAQVGIGTTTPDPSAVLDLVSTTRGFLMPRMTTAERNAIPNPATGLMIYNQTNSEMQVNGGTPGVPAWFGMKGNLDSTSTTSVTDGVNIFSSSVIDTLIVGMTLSPAAGTYLVLFNGQYGLISDTAISTAQGVADLTAAYNSIMAIPATNTTHGAIFGNGETLVPGVYDLPAAASWAGTLTLDGGGDTNSVFIIRTGGALAAGAGTTVVLTNGAKANNIFWVSEGALSLAANTIMKGTMIAHNAAVAAAAGSNVVGRMFSTTGAISMGPGTIALPAGPSYINLGVLSTFIIFTSAGAISNTDPSMMTGDVGTHAGAIAGFGNLNGNIYYPGAPPPTNTSLATFSIYQNGMLVPFSSRTSDINTSEMALQALATVATGQTIDVRWRVDVGSVQLGNRVLSLVNANR
ncbi:MAG: ice-binding family protein [Saprospiraceae bacterium]